MNENRRNQDKYDVIQAQEEWASMHLPRNVKEAFADLRAKADRLEKLVTSLRAEINRLKNDEEV